MKLIEAFGETFNPDNISYLFESPGWPAKQDQTYQPPYTAIMFVSEGCLKIENKTRREVREEVNKQIDLLIPCVEMRPGSGIPALSPQVIAAIAEEDYIPWGGGECPVGLDVPVTIKTRGGDVYTACARTWRWNHYDTDGDIVEYKTANFSK